jgi:outer membrane protein OmpA-like peptidoglycan-associated protein
MNRPSPWLFETPTATQPEYETALKTEWEMRPPSRARSRPAARPAGRPSRAPSRSTSQPVSRSPRRPLSRPRQTHPRQQTIVVPSYLNQPNSTSSVSASSGTGANRILIATIDQFEFGSYLLKKHQFEQLHDLIIILNGNKKSWANMQLAFDGHTDSIGGVSKGNKALSFRRALEVEDFVRGFARMQRLDIATRSRGSSSEEPIAPNTTKDGQARNRRVEVFSDVPLQPAK